MEAFPVHGRTQAAVIDDVPWYYAQPLFPLQYQRPAVAGILKPTVGISKHQKQRAVKTLRFHIDTKRTASAFAAPKSDVKPETAKPVQTVLEPLSTTSADDASFSYSESTLTTYSDAEGSTMSGRPSVSSEASSASKPSRSSSTDKTFELPSRGSGRTSSGGKPFVQDRGPKKWVIGRLPQEWKDRFGKGTFFGGDGITSIGRRWPGSGWALESYMTATWPHWYPRYDMMALSIGFLLLVVIAATMIMSKHTLRNDRTEMLGAEVTLMPDPMAEDADVVRGIREPFDGRKGADHRRNPPKIGGNLAAEESEPFEETEESSPHRVTLEVDETTEARHTLEDIQEIVGNLRRSQSLVARFPQDKMVPRFQTPLANSRDLGVNLTSRA